MNTTTYYYSIFDINSPVLDSRKEIQADSPIKAVKLYLKYKGEEYKSIKVDGSNYARIKAEPFIINDGVKYRTSRKKSMWFKIEN